MCLLIAMNYRHKDLEQALSELLRRPSIINWEADSILDIFDQYGLSDGEQLNKMVDEFLQKKYSHTHMTFIEFAKVSGKNLVVCVSNLTKECTEFFSVDTTPNLSIAQAIRISCSLPIMFAPVKLNDNLYLDGGLYNNFPIDYFPEHELKDILGINISITNYQCHTDFLRYMRFIFTSLLEKFNSKPVNSKDRNVITLEFEDPDDLLNSIQISLSDDKIHKYIEMGYEAAKSHIKPT